MRKDEKTQLIEALAEKINTAGSFYIADIADLNAENSVKLRRLCYKRNIELSVVKNTLLKKALEKTGKDYENLFSVLHGPTSIMFSDVANDPAKLIQEFRRTSPKPILKGAYVQESIYLGDDQINSLVNIKSKNELLGDIIWMLQSPMTNVVSALQSGGNIISGLVKTMSERAE